MSITLAAADTIAGVAGSATAITYTITGDEVGTSDTFKVLAQGQLPNAIATIYTVPASTAAIVKTIHLVNTTAGTVTASLTVKGTAAANQILPPISILAGGFAVYGDDGWQVYNSGGQILSVGSTGATGSAGAAGVAGATGQPGNDGADGDDGASGIPGERGATGSTGSAGVSNVPGATGPPGFGADGDDGPIGPPGPAGPTGPAGAAGSSTDPVQSLFGTPTTAFEFDTSSFTGLTAMGTPTNEDANTTVPSAYYIRQAAGLGTSFKGRYAATPAMPFTAVCEVTDENARSNFNGVALFVGVATPGKFETGEMGVAARSASVQLYTNPTTYLSTPTGATLANVLQGPFYIGVVANSTISLDWYVSSNGWIWTPIGGLALDPALTVGSVGIAINNDNATTAMSAAFGFLRIWSGAKTFPGA